MGSLKLVVSVLKTHWTYGVLYLLATLGFAAWYTQIAEEFQQSSGEPAWVAFERGLEAGLAEDVQEFLFHIGGESVSSVRGLRVENGRALFEVSYRGSTGSSRAGVFACMLKIPHVGSSGMVGIEMTNLDPELVSRMEEAGVSRLNGAGPIRGVLEPDRGVLNGTMLVTVRRAWDLVRFVNDSRTSLEGDIRLRFLYFSVVTITTLGFGDIVPVTSRARTIVALESFLGVVLMGLFVGFAVGGGNRCKCGDTR